MYLNHSVSTDMPAIMEIIHNAQVYLATQKIDQWQNGYPDEAQIQKDISSKESYVVKSDEGIIMATSMFTLCPESTYVDIDGKWLTGNNSIYGVVHRLAIGKEYRKSGLAQYLFSQFEMQLKELKIKSLKVDTHRGNIGMQNLLKKIGYSYCGVITLESGDERLAFEKILIDT